MARKRMFDSEIINQDDFMDLPMEAKALYFLLGMEADDEGFVSYRKILRLYGGTEDSIKLLAIKKFIIMFKSGVIVITDWKRNNYLNATRIKPTIYQEEKKMLVFDESLQQYLLNECLTDVKQMLNQKRIEEKRIEEKSVVVVEENEEQNEQQKKQEVLGCTNVQQLYDKSTPEIEIDIEKNMDIKKEIKKEIGNNVTKMLPKCYTEIEKEIDVVVEEKQQQLQKLFINCTSSTNLNAIQECISYLDDLPYEVIEIALKKTSEKNGGWKYAKTILQNWLKAGIKTIEQVQAEELNFKSKKDNKNIIKTNRIAYSEEDFTPEQWDRWMKDEMTEQELKSILEERKCMMKN